MFGFTKLTPEETIERTTRLRIEELDSLLVKETLKRATSLELSGVLRNELEELLK